jgi:hypothetical protein
MALHTDSLNRGAWISVVAAVCALVAVMRAAPATDTEKPDFSGTWALDRNISTDPAQIDFAPAATANRQPQRDGFGGGGGIGGFGGGRSRQRTNGQGSEGLTQVEQDRLKALTDQLKTATGTLVISHHEPDFVVNDAQNHTLFLHTTGVNDDNNVGATTISSSTHWDGSRLVTECVLGSRLTLVYTYTLLPNTKQLVVRISRPAGDRQRAGQDVRLVYRPAQK